MTSQQKIIAAIEIGSSKIKGAVGTIDEYGTLTVQAVETVAVIDSVRYGWIRNISAVSAAVSNIKRQLEARIAPQKIYSVYVGIGGRSIKADERNVERQLSQEVEISLPLLDNLRNEACQNTDFNDREIISVIPCEYRVDGTVTSQPAGMIGRNVRSNFKIVTCKLQQRRNLEMVISQKLNLRINDYVVRQLAQGDFLLTREEKSLGCMLVDFGAETTTVSIYKNGTLRYLTTIPLGSRLITRDIVSLNFMEEQAEDIKSNFGTVMVPATNPMGNQAVSFSEINNYINARVKEIIANIKAQLQFAGFLATDLPAGIIIVGNGAKLNGFNSRLSAEMKMPVRAGVPGASVRISDGSINPSEMIDIISVMYSASTQNPLECTVEPISEPQQQQQVEQRPQYPNPGTQPAERYTPNPAYRVDYRQDSQPAYRQEPRADYRQESQPAYRQEPRADYRQESQPAYRQDPKPDYRQDSQPAYRQEPRADYRQESQPAYRQDPKPDYRQESQPAYRQDPKPDYRQESQPAYRQEPKPDYRQESQPDPEPVADPEPESPIYSSSPAPRQKRPSPWAFIREKISGFMQESEGDFDDDLRDDR